MHLELDNSHSHEPDAAASLLKRDPRRFVMLVSLGMSVVMLVGKLTAY